MILEYERTEARVTLKKPDAERTQLVCDRDRVLYCLNKRYTGGDVGIFIAILD